LRGPGVLADASALKLLDFSVGRCDMLVCQVYGKQNQAASRHSGL
jgi:hypothetical protein